MLKDYLGEDKYNELKADDNLIYKALEITSILFKKDLDKGGLPYFLHLLYVYRHVTTKEEKVIALLHDTIEDKNVSEEELIDIGFTEKIVKDVSILTRKKKEDYSKYIDNLINNASREALCVKLADLRNNMDLSRIKNPTLKDYERVEKRYTPSYEKILNRLNEMER